MKIVIRLGLFVIVAYVGYALFSAIGAGGGSAVLSGIGLAIALLVFARMELLIWLGQRRDD